jgi:universal stress protein E
LEGRAQTQVCKRLEILAAPLRKLGTKISVAARWDFPAYEAVIRHAARTGADLLVADRHASHPFPRWLLQMNDWELLRACPVPLLLVKTRHPVVLAAVDPTHAEKPARLDEDILSASATVARALRGTLHVVHAHPSVLSGSRPTDAFNPSQAARINADFAARAKAQVERLLKSTPLPRGRRHLSGAVPADAIAGVARQTGSAMVVMGALSRSGLKGIFIGNTAERALDQLTCDVLIIKPAHFKARVPKTSRGARLVPLIPPMA